MGLYPCSLDEVILYMYCFALETRRQELNCLTPNIVASRESSGAPNEDIVQSHLT